jgi:hypothetical protein
MIYNLASNDSNKYGTLKFGTTIHGWRNNLKCRVINFSTIASFEMTTSDDYIMIDSTKYHFKTKCDYTLNTIVDDVNEVIKNSGLKFEYRDGNYGFNSKDDDGHALQYFTHRVGMICGLYELDMKTFFMIYMFKRVNFPLLNYGNVLYLKSSLPKTVGLNIKGDETHQCVAYKIAEMCYYSLPILSKEKGEWITVKTEDMQRMIFQLCDCFLEPIICRSPIFITLEVTF